MLKLTKIQFFRIFLLYTLLALAAVSCYNFKKFFGPAKKRPFQCYDETISKPFVLFDTVSPKQLHILGIYIPIALITGCELYFSLALRKSLRNSRWILKYVLKCSVILTLFLIGLAVERVFKNIAKLKMARLRPNFITVCNPVNSDGYRCQDLDDTIIMTEYECSSELYPSWAVSSAFGSFPSGHTSLTSYGMVFLVCYLHLLSLKLKYLKPPSTLMILIVQILCLFMIIFVGMSRVLDFRHHWSDVMAGFVFGSSIAATFNWYLKGQLINIDKRLEEVLGHGEENEEATKASYLNENTHENEESCAIELGSV